MWLIFAVEHVTTKSVYIVNYHWRGWQLKFGPLTFLLRRSSNPKGKFLSTGLLMAEETGHMTHQEVLKPNRRATGLLNAEQTGHTTQNGAPDQSHDTTWVTWQVTWPLTHHRSLSWRESLEEVYPEPHWNEPDNQHTTPVTKCGHTYTTVGVEDWWLMVKRELGLITTGASPENIATKSCRWLNRFSLLVNWILVTPQMAMPCTYEFG